MEDMLVKIKAKSYTYYSFSATKSNADIKSPNKLVGINPFPEREKSYSNCHFEINSKKKKSTVQHVFKDHTRKVIKESCLHQVVFKCRFYYVDLRRGVVSEQWSLKAA